jgi:preprotein translocase subunit YajC
MPHRLVVALRQGMVLLLAAVVMFLQTVPSFARATREDAEKAKVEKLGVGQHVMVKTLGGEELHGNITVIGDQSFKVKPDKATAERDIAYSQVAKVRENPGKTGWIILAVVVAVVIVAVVAIIHAKNQPIFKGPIL